MVGRVAYYSMHASELVYIFQMKKEFKQFRPSDLCLKELSQTTNDLHYCYEALKKVSRSFSVVIQQLPEELKDPVCLFYLILRGLDTIEDDMQIEVERKKVLLLGFADRINREEFILENIGDTQDYRDLMLHFDKIIREFQRLDAPYKRAITETTKEMALGMIKYAQKQVNSYKDWDDYCHYVAGLVGIGLSKLFIASKLEDNPQLNNEGLSNEMGLFLQKTNIIRDYAEDLEQGRSFWPQEAWSDRVPSLDALQVEEVGVTVLNEIIINALRHVPACLEYLSGISNPKIFRFCAIPQLMAVATLDKLFDNPSVLTENVKIRKGKTARYFIAVHDFESAKKEFISVLQKLEKKDKTGEVFRILKSIKG